MRKSATDIMQDILFAATLDAIAAFKAASKNVPNALLRDLNALHPNTAIGDLPAEAQAAIAKSVRDAFTRLLKHGYAIGPAAPGARPERPPRAPIGRPARTRRAVGRASRRSSRSSARRAGPARPRRSPDRRFPALPTPKATAFVAFVAFVAFEIRPASAAGHGRGRSGRRK